MDTRRMICTDDFKKQKGKEKYMTLKEKLIACKKAYTERGCKLIEITHDDGRKSGIANPKAINIVMEALKKELDRQIAECD